MRLQSTAHSAPSSIKDGGTSLAYRPDPWVVRAMREIDPSLGLEWRTLGRWSKEASPGCWRITLKGKSGNIKGMRLWPPECADGRLIAYLKTHWLPKIRAWRDYHQTLECFNEELADRKAAERQRREWDKIDHWDMWRAMREADADVRGAGESGQVYWAGADLSRSA